MSEKAENVGQLLKVGTPAIVHPDPDRADSARLRAVIRGWQPGGYIILDIPREEVYAFKVDQHVVIRFVAEGDACGCDCRILDRGSGPFFSFVRVSWPNEFTSVRIRKHERVEVNVPCTVQPLGGPSFQAEISDVSTGGCRLLSSHALAQDRVYGTQFRAVALLHVSEDHLDFHGTREAYLEAKARLFDPLHRGGPLELEPVRAVTFQSIMRMSSPGTYSRCDANSTL